MKALDRPFPAIINGTTQFVIPVFQRDYTWTEARCEQLWKDVLQVGGGGAGSRHFLGSVVYVSTGDSSAGFTRWLLVDGQQRVTTLTLLLIALRDHIRETGWEGDEDGPTAKRVEAYFLKNLQEEGDRSHKLVLRRHDHKTLKSLLDGTEPPEFVAERLQENYDYFRDRLGEADPALVYQGIGRLVVVDVTLDRASDDPQLIFESLNSTGMDLSQSDLIRNFILMRLPEREQTQLYEAVWSRIERLFRGSERTFDSFARDYLALKTRASKQEKADEIYAAFRRFFLVHQAEVGGPEAALQDMLRFARYYAAFTLGVEARPAVATALARLRRLVDVPALLVMRLFDCHDRVGSLTEAQFIEAIELIESYVLRRAICGEQTRAYWQVFANLAHRVESDRALDSLRVALACLGESYRFPDNERFQRELEERDLYGLRVCWHLLDRIENDGNKEPTDTSNYTIEHVMPQNQKLAAAWREMLGDSWRDVQQRWLHRLGNLTLTGYNSTYSDRPFEEKKKVSGGFDYSSVRLNRFIREQRQWTSHSMETRGRMLARQALSIWKPLVVDSALIEEARIAEMRDLAARRDAGKVKMSERARGLFEELRNRVKGLGPEVVELAEAKSVSYHAPEFFLEVLPRKHRITLLLPLDYNEIEDPTGIAEDATQWKFFFYAAHEGGVALRIKTRVDIDAAMPLLRQALAITCR